MEPLTFTAIAVIAAKLLEPAYQKTIEIATEKFWSQAPQLKPVIEAGSTIRNLLSKDKKTANVLESIDQPQMKDENKIYLTEQSIKQASELISSQTSPEIRTAVQMLTQMSQMLPKQAIENNIEVVTDEQYQAVVREIGIRNLESKRTHIKNFSMSSEAGNVNQPTERIGIDGAKIDQFDIDDFSFGSSKKK